MTDDPATFREISGVGPATEAELHEAGVRTWSSLATVLGALARVKGLAGDALRALRDEARQRASEASAASDARLADPDDGGFTSGQAADQQAAVQPTEAEDAERDPFDAQDGASPQHTLSLHAGEILGGHGKTMNLTLSTADVDSPNLTYDARLVARAYGDPQAAWATLGRQSGQVAPPEQVSLHFGDVDLAVGIHRVRLDMTVTLPAPSRETPAIMLV